MARLGVLAGKALTVIIPGGLMGYAALLLAGAELVYRPPVLAGLPVHMLSAGTRGASPTQEAPGPSTLAILAPQQAALVGHPQPELYWFLEAPAPAQVRVRILQATEEQREEVFSGTITTSQSGWQRLALAELSFSLTPNRPYRLELDLPSAKVPSKAKATLVYRPVDQDLGLKLSDSPPAHRPGLYAGAGYWFDAVAGLNPLHPDPEQRSQLAALALQTSQPELSRRLAGAAPPH